MKKHQSEESLGSASLGGVYHPTSYTANPMLIIYPLNLKGYMISMGSAAWGGKKKLMGGGKPMSTSTNFFFKVSPFPFVKLSTYGTQMLYFHVVYISVQTLSTTSPPLHTSYCPCKLSWYALSFTLLFSSHTFNTFLTPSILPALLHIKETDKKWCGRGFWASTKKWSEFPLHTFTP